MNTRLVTVSEDGRTARRGRTQERIERAAADLFADRGYTGTSIDDVAATAGVSKGSVFYNYGSKAELFTRLLQQAGDALAADIAEAHEGRDGWEALSAATLAVLERVDASPAMAQLLLTELFRQGRPWADELPGIRARLLAPLEAILDEVAHERRAAGLVPEGADLSNAQSVAVALVGALALVALDRGAFGRNRPLAEVHERLMLVVSGLRQ